MTVLILPAAEDDLEGIWEYSRVTWGEAQADTYYWKIASFLKALPKKMFLAKPIAGKSGMFRLRIEEHLAIFRKGRDALIVVRVLHKAQDVERHI